ncbi:MAG: hydrogenase maturation protease [Ardenticatenaceae bacterium]|nr:hydrogenase maturation protease [Ardenticatenaceae bacterium]MCB9442983.1 hydrogenase maturation protease [Ardenticatenaceae bacterium]
MKTIVIGLGNPILTDDGVGVKVAYELERILSNSRPPAANHDIFVTEASAGGLRLMELMIGYDRAIIVDAFTNGRNTPGKMHRMTLDDLRAVSPTQHSASAHDTTLVTALDAGREMGMHLPDEVVIYAIEVENVIDFSDEPTTAVAAAIPGAVTAVLAELERINTE